ncbi:MAG: threonine/serine exporter family protein, partial [Lysobacter sp.]|nr:threonine/serine exporter family protein [Lysobacter sp.]
MSIFTPASERYAARIDFVVDMAQRLHAYGTTAQRLEGALMAVAHKLKLDCEVWS